MPKGKVMIVDDDSEFLQELKEILDLSGYEVTQISDPKAVVRKAADMVPDVILLDLKMEGLNGFEVADQLKHNDKTGHVPIIAMTGFFTEEEHMALMNICGIERCILKPFNPLDVISAIEMALKVHK
jgi:DNA-binding response OmpR family regulator